MKINLKNKGITLIALIITIIVMLILVAVTIRIAVNGGLFDYAGEAAKKQKQAQLSELMTIDDYMRLISENTESNVLIWSGEQTGTSGTLTLPTPLNDASYIYELDVKSDKYTGPAILNVYSFSEGNYTGQMSFDDNNAYTWKIRNLQAGFLNAENIVNVAYSGTKGNSTDTATLTYNASQIGSEIEITSIRKTKRQYSPFGNIVIKLRNGQDLTADDIVPCINYALNYGDLGYELVNSNVYTYNFFKDIPAEQRVIFNSQTERSILSNIASNRRDDINAIAKIIRDHIIATFDNSTFTSTNMNADAYTMGNGIEENPYYSEFTNKVVGNSIVPFIFIYLDNKGLPDLNEDGRIVNANITGIANDNINLTSEYTEDNNIAINSQYLYSVDNYAGLYTRIAADAFSVVNKNSSQNMSQEDTEWLQEITSNLEGMEYTSGFYWIKVFQNYHSNNLNNIYTAIHNNNITINYAGIRLGYYTYILPDANNQWSEKGFSFNDTYDPTQDTEYLRKQGVESLIAALASGN